VTVSVDVHIEEYDSLAELGTCLVTVLTATVIFDSAGGEFDETMAENSMKVVMDIVIAAVTWRVTVKVAPSSELFMPEALPGRVYLDDGLPAPDDRPRQEAKFGWPVSRDMSEAKAQER
jgi:hypothetical protein